MPDSVTPTWEGRHGQWMIEPFPESNPWWIPIAAAAPAILATILVFMDQQITVVIVNRKEHKLKVIMESLDSSILGPIMGAVQC